MATRRSKRAQPRKSKAQVGRNRKPSGPIPAETPSAPEVPSERYTIQLRYRLGDELRELHITINDRTFYPFVQRWRYVVANRRRITRDTRNELSSSILSWVRDLAEVAPRDLEDRIKEMAAAAVVEVRIPYITEETGWAARLFPWESALWLLASVDRDDPSTFTVVRFLDCRTTQQPTAPPTSALIIRSGPGEIGRLFDLDREAEMVQGVFSSLAPTTLRDPDRQSLREAIAAQSPSIVHYAGVDPSALESLSLAEVDAEKVDGVVLRGGTKGFDSVGPMDCANIVNAGARKPLLASFSTCFSATRVAALTTAQGSQHAIGFLDTVSDADAMLFFSVFYREWSRTWDILAAFQAARHEWATQPSAQNTQRSGIVLWSRRSLIETTAAEASAQRAAVRSKRFKTRHERVTPGDLQLHIALVQDKVVLGGVRNVSSTSLNYSLLHNDRSPFRIFTVEKPKQGGLPPLEIEVALEVGAEVCRCRFSEFLPEEPCTRDLLERIRLPLVAGLLRQCSESLRSNLYINVKCGDRLLRESSERVTVLPADEWRDDGEDHRWLPCFVLPRDPAVLKVIACAQRYLRTLLDDCSAGFDGYQQLAEDDSNAADIVDPQVQAIWAALQHDLPVSYINPPPSYTSQSQRLRTPTEIFKGNAATCIDLALLFASCLEFVGIYAVVFLISGHAFPGYWRSDKAWWRMKKFQFDRGDQPTTLEVGQDWQTVLAESARSVVTPGQSEGWMFAGRSNLGELLSYVQRGTLVPFESTYVTGRRGFFQALEQGSSNLHPESFDAMVDIQSARGENVTPLPLLDRLD
jgi:hypothetical protein